MKKILAIFLLALLAACGGDDDPVAGTETRAGGELASGAGNGETGATGGGTSGGTNGGTNGGTSGGANGDLANGGEEATAFLTDAYQRNLGEIALAQLALDQSENEDARAFAQRLLTHHQFLNQRIAMVLGQTETTLPEAPTSEATARLQELGNLDGIEFDRVWANTVVQQHQTAVNEFRQWADLVEAYTQGETGGLTASATADGTGGATSSASASGNGTATATAGDDNGNTSASGSASGGTSGSSSATSAIPGTGAGDDDRVLTPQLLALNALPAMQVHLEVAKTLAGTLDPAVFLTNLYRDGLAEIQLSQLALNQSQDGEVRAFAQRMIDDHTTANQQIAAQAQVLGVTLPQELSAEQQAIADELARMSGENFEKAYMNHNVLAHEAAVAQARAQAENGTDDGVTALAATLQPVLQMHLAMSDTLYSRLVPGPLFATFSTGAGEVLLSQLALQLSDDDQVRQFAESVIAEHSSANEQARDLARELERELPSEAAAEAVRAYVDLSQLDGDEFNRAFLERNVQLNELAVQLVERGQANEQNEQVQSFSGEMLPVLRDELEQGRQLLQAVQQAGQEGDGDGQQAGSAADDAQTVQEGNG